VARPGLGAPGAAKNMIRTCEIPYLYLLNAAGSRDLPLRLRRRLAARNAIFQFSRSWRSPGRLTITPN
jgi:hypothetical protein